MRFAGVGDIRHVVDGTHERFAVLVGEVRAEQDSVSTERIYGATQCGRMAVADGVEPQTVYRLTRCSGVSGASHETWSSARRVIIGNAPPRWEQMIFTPDTAADARR